MKHLLSSLCILFIAFSFIACGDKKVQQDIQAPVGMVALDLSKYGKPFLIFVPDTTTAKLEVVEQSWGALEIKVGKNFQLAISEDPGDMALKKSDITSNDVNIFKSYIINEPLTIFWESSITKPEYHFYTIQKVAGNSYVIEDIVPADGEPIGKESVQKMLDSALKLVEKQQPEA